MVLNATSLLPDFLRKALVWYSVHSKPCCSYSYKFSLHLVLNSSYVCYTVFEGLNSVYVAFSVYESVHNLSKCPSFTWNLLSRETVRAQIKVTRPGIQHREKIRGHYWRSGKERLFSSSFLYYFLTPSTCVVLHNKPIASVKLPWLKWRTYNLSKISQTCRRGIKPLKRKAT